jgi:uroporphyrinogen III methyltransferase/synthase
MHEFTVVITRPREQAGELKSELERSGAHVILFPTIEIAAPDSYAELDAAVLNLAAFDWLIFTSANAVEYFLLRLAANNVEPAELDYLRVCAVGEATFEKLSSSQIHVDVVPFESRAEGIFDALAEYLGGAESLRDLRFLLPRSAIGRDFLPQKLASAGASVTTATAYQSVLPKQTETGKLKALLQGGAIDCIAFTSPSTFTNFLEIFKDQDLPQLLKDPTLAAIGKTTADAIRQHNFTAEIISPAADAKTFARAIADYFRR